MLFFFTGFAFIEFEDPRDAEDAVRDMDGRYVCGVRIRVELAKNSSRSVSERIPYLSAPLMVSCVSFCHTAGRDTVATHAGAHPRM